MKQNIENLEPGQIARIKWNGDLYIKDQHYHVTEVRRNEVCVRVPGSYISLIIKKRNIKECEIVK